MAETASTEVEKWLGHIATYDRAFKKWESRVEKIIKRYRDDGRTPRETGAKFNILWSNVQTLSAATFARLPKPDVSRRFRDNDPIGRIGSLILERALDYEVQHYSDYRSALKSSVLDRFLGGRATAWARYEPHFRAQETGLPPDGAQVTEDVPAPQEVLDYECAPVDYVHWKDFGHKIARTWEEVGAVWRKVYMTREALVERFGEEGEKVPLDAKPEELKRNDIDTEDNRGCVYEIWDKEKKQAIWIAKSLGKELDRRDDPLGLKEFFPCPKPMYATLTNDTLVPVPDFTLYQDQARELDTLSDRIDGLINALKVRGVYNAAEPALARLFTEGNNNDLLPVINWAAFAEKNGLKGAIDLVDLTVIGNALQAAYLAMEQIKGQVYEITRISDIMRGQVDPQEKLGQSQLKSQYGNLGIKAYQEQVAEFATELLQIKAQIMCNKFSPETLLAISAADQLNVTDSDVLAVAPELGQAPQPPQMPGMPPQPPMPPPIAQMPKEAKKQIVLNAALKLLLGERAQDPNAESTNPMRSFRIEVVADSLIYLDEQMERQSRMEFLDAQSQFMERFVLLMQQAGPAAPALVPLGMEMWKFGVTGFKVGKTIEGAFDEAAEKLKQIAAQPPQPPQPTPKEKVDMVKAETELKLEPIRAQTEQVKANAAGVKAEAETVKARASMVEAEMGLKETMVKAANPAAFAPRPARPQ